MCLNYFVLQKYCSLVKSKGCHGVREKVRAKKEGHCKIDTKDQSSTKDIAFLSKKSKIF